MAWLELEHREDLYPFLHAHHIPMTTLHTLELAAQRGLLDLPTAEAIMHSFVV
jgi:hypothetical protein